MKILDATVSALCHQICSGRDSALAPPYNDVTRFVASQMDRMPRHLGLGIRAATALFAVCGIRYGGTLFHRLEPGRRALQIDTWKLSRIGPCRDLIRFYESLATLSLYDRLLHE